MTVLVFYYIKFFRYRFECLIPGNALPLAGSAFTNALEGPEDSILAVNSFRPDSSLGTEPAWDYGFKADDFFVFDVGIDRTASAQACRHHGAGCLYYTGSASYF